MKKPIQMNFCAGMSEMFVSDDTVSSQTLLPQKNEAGPAPGIVVLIQMAFLIPAAKRYCSPAGELPDDDPLKEWVP
jgi:hypothetical protein